MTMQFLETGFSTVLWLFLRYSKYGLIFSYFLAILLMDMALRESCAKSFEEISISLSWYIFNANQALYTYSHSNIII